jgi:hypothetical protein
MTSDAVKGMCRRIRELSAQVETEVEKATSPRDISFDARRCPTCGATGLVLDTRTIRLTVKRRRSCVSCGSRWTTQEVVVHGSFANGPRIMRVGKIVAR